MTTLFDPCLDPEAYRRHPFVSRSVWVDTPLPTATVRPQYLTAQFPWWSQQRWVGAPTVPPPRVYYPQPQWPRGLQELDSSAALPALSAPSSSSTAVSGEFSGEFSGLTPHWAFTR